MIDYNCFIYHNFNCYKRSEGCCAASWELESWVMMVMFVVDSDQKVGDGEVFSPSPMRQAANTSSARQRFYLLGFQSCWSNQQLWKPGLGTFYFRVTAGQISDFRKTRRFIPPEWQQWLPVTRPQQQISGVIRKMYHNQHCSGLLQFPRNALDPASLTVWRLILFPIN